MDSPFMRTPRRLRLLLVCVSLTASCLAQSLREQADALGFLVGSAVRPYALTEPQYSATLGREFNMVEAEDAMKWWVLRPDQSTFDFRQGDQIVGFAETHRMKVRGHTLVWGWTNPPWLTSQTFTVEQLAQILHEHITRVAGHYRGKVFAWDVLNEGFDEHGKVKPSIWYDQPGIGFAGKSTAYIEQTFRWTHEADPDALLFYNDGGAETVNAKSDALYAMVKDFKGRGVPIDGIGLQMHTDLHPDIPGIEANIARFTALGVQVHLTEMDVWLPVDANGNATAADLAAQAEIYRQITSICLAHPGCNAIQTWGFTDKYSWVGSASKKTKGAALLFDRNYAPKPAYEAIKKALAASTPRKR